MLPSGPGTATVGFDYSQYVSFGAEYRSTWGRAGEVHPLPVTNNQAYNYHPVTVTFMASGSARRSFQFDWNHSA